jgi:hypothetical protein
LFKRNHFILLALNYKGLKLGIPGLSGVIR